MFENYVDILKTSMLDEIQNLFSLIQTSRYKFI